MRKAARNSAGNNCQVRESGHPRILADEATGESVREIESAAGTFKVQVQKLDVLHPKDIVKLAAGTRLPAIYARDEFVEVAP